MITRLIVLVLALLASCGYASAQEVDVSKIYMGTGGITITNSDSTGVGNPDGSITANPGSLHLDRVNGHVWRKRTGTGNTGWTNLVGYGSNVTNGKLTVFDATGLIDSLVSQSGAVVTVTGSLVTTGGITAGSGAVGIVDSTGKIPAISSTYFASLSGANLTALPAGQLTGTIASAVQDNITRTGTLVSGATGAGYTLALSTSIVSGNLPYTNMPAGAGTWTATPTISGAVTFGDNIGTASYVSQTTGWRVSLAGEADFRYQFVDQLQAKTFIANLEQASAGSEIITPGVAVVHSLFGVPGTGSAVASITRSGSVATVNTVIGHGFSNGDFVYISGADQSDYNGAYTVTVTDSDTFTYTVGGSPASPATGTITARGAVVVSVKDLPGAANMQVFQENDFVAFHSFTRASGGLVIGDVVGQVISPDTSPVDYQTWLFIRSLPPNGGSLARGTVIEAESLALDYATSGSGFWHVTAVDGMVNVTSITRSSSTATVTTTIPHGYLTGDVVYISGADQAEYNGAFGITVTSATTFTYTVSGTPATPATGTILVNGTRGTNAPYAQVVTWTVAPTAANKVVRTRLGNVRGLTGVNNEFGLIAGSYAATNGQFLRATNVAFELHGIDLTLWDGSTTVFAMRRNAGSPYFSIGNPAPTTFGSGAGVWMGKDSSAYKFRVGDPSGGHLAWDGTTLTAAGWTVNASTLTGGNATLASSGNLTLGTSNDVIRISADDATYRLWIGHATAASAPFRVTKTGAVTMTEATLSGPDITIGANATAYDSSGALKFTRATGRQYGASGDIFALYETANSAVNDIFLENTVVGGADFPADSSVYLRATGWNDAGAGSATTPAEIRVRSAIGVSDVSVTADAIRASSGLYERGRSTRLGEWDSVAHSGANFTGNGSMTWTVAAGDQVRFKYTLVGKTMHVNFWLDTTTVGGTPNTDLQITIPGGFTAASTAVNNIWASDNGTQQSAVAWVGTGGTTIFIQKIGVTNWTASTDATFIRGNLTFEIQ